MTLYPCLGCGTLIDPSTDPSQWFCCCCLDEARRKKEECK